MALNYVEVMAMQHHGFLPHDVIQGWQQRGGRGQSSGREGGDEKVLELLVDSSSIGRVRWIFWQRMKAMAENGGVKFRRW